MVNKWDVKHDYNIFLLHLSLKQLCLWNCCLFLVSFVTILITILVKVLMGGVYEIELNNFLCLNESSFFFPLNDVGENWVLWAALVSYPFFLYLTFCGHVFIDIASTAINYNTILTAVVNQLVGWVGLLLDKKILQDLHMGTGLLLHHVTGFVLYVDVWILPAGPPVFRLCRLAIFHNSSIFPLCSLLSHPIFQSPDHPGTQCSG
jgi:hypothetical protein